MIGDAVNFGLGEESFGLPDKVTCVEFKSSEFKVSTSNSEFSYSFLTNFGLCTRSTFFEGSLFLMDGNNSSSLSSLVS